MQTLFNCFQWLPFWNIPLWEKITNMYSLSTYYSFFFHILRHGVCYIFLLLTYRSSYFDFNFPYNKSWNQFRSVNNMEWLIWYYHFELIAVITWTTLTKSIKAGAQMKRLNYLLQPFLKIKWMPHYFLLRTPSHQVL